MLREEVSQRIKALTIKENSILQFKNPKTQNNKRKGGREEKCQNQE